MQNLLPVLKNGWVRRSLTRFVKETPALRYIRLLQPETRLWGRERGALPSFLIIGAQRSGSTFLHDHLVASTSAQCSPLQKEVHYFDNKYYKSLDWYARFFESTSEQDETVKTFETSPGYLYNPAAPERIEQSLPSVKVVAVLRDPVERALSQYRWMRQVGLETRGATEAFRYDVRRLDLEEDPAYLERFKDPLYFNFDRFHRGYIRRSLYHLQFRRWLQHLHPSRFRVIDSNKLFSNTHEVVQVLSSFLGIEYYRYKNRIGINKNSSSKGIVVPKKAREIAGHYLRGVKSKTISLLSDEVVIGKSLM